MIPRLQTHADNPAATLAADQNTARRLSRVLTQHYSGHAWAVHVDSAQGMAFVENWNLSTREGFRIRLKDVDAKGLERTAIWAGGEFLERFNVRRGEADREQMSAMSKRA